MSIASSYRLPERPDLLQESQRTPPNLLELLDRILDKGVVIIGDIKISIADIELLKIQIRLLIASVDKAKELGIDFSWARGLVSKDGSSLSLPNGRRTGSKRTRAHSSQSTRR